MDRADSRGGVCLRRWLQWGSLACGGEAAVADWSELPSGRTRKTELREGRDNIKPGPRHCPATAFIPSPPPRHILHGNNMASQADYKDRQFLAVIGDEVSCESSIPWDWELICDCTGLRHRPVARRNWSESFRRTGPAIGALTTLNSMSPLLQTPKRTSSWLTQRPTMPQLKRPSTASRPRGRISASS